VVGVSAAAATNDASKKKVFTLWHTLSYSDMFPNFHDIISNTLLLVKVNTVPGLTAF
jgi:hypothetical protein